jgi:hypothetical protein
MIAKMSRMTASYCGLKVEVVTQMENCSLILFHGRTFIVAPQTSPPAPCGKSFFKGSGKI